MPYIKENRRVAILSGEKPHSPGELNFQLTELVQSYLEDRAVGEPNYTLYNEVLGVLTAMQHEIYRRMVVPYEDEKIAENGDVFPRKEASYA